MALILKLIVLAWCSVDEQMHIYCPLLKNNLLIDITGVHAQTVVLLYIRSVI